MTEAIKKIDGWEIRASQTLICIPCIVDMGESGFMGPCINGDDKIISLENYVVVNPDSCDFLEDHEVDIDKEVQDALDKLVAQGKATVEIIDGVPKYRAIQCNCHWCTQGTEHPDTHSHFSMVSPQGDTLMVACETCGHLEPLNRSKQPNVTDLGN